MAKRSDKHRHRLVVEGKDLHAIVHLTRAHGVDWDDVTNDAPFVHEAGDWERARDGFQLALQAPSYMRVGVVLDADQSASNRWASVRNAMTRAGWTAPASIPPEGWVDVQGERRAGVWLMPDNLSTGRLEELLACLIPDADPCWTHAKTAADEALRLGAPFAPIDLLKAQLHTWLAWRAEPGLPYGTAIKARQFDPASPAAAPFVSWFQRLFL